MTIYPLCSRNEADKRGKSLMGFTLNANYIHHTDMDVMLSLSDTN